MPTTPISDTPFTLTQDKPVERALTLVKPNDEQLPAQTPRRTQYQAMQMHMERAALALAAGASYKFASQYSGVSKRQITKYYTDPDFRSRIDELRKTMTSKLQGRIIQELLARTAPNKIGRIDLLDLLRIGDRVGLARGANAEGEAAAGGSTSYETIFNTIFLTHTGAQGGDFPIYGNDRLSLPGGDPPE